MAELLKERMKQYVLRLYPDAIFTEEDGSDIFWYTAYGVAELQFYPCPEVLLNYTRVDCPYSCVCRNGEITIYQEY